MTKTYYLYGSDLKELRGLNYEDALKRRIELSNILITELLNINYMNRDALRIHKSLESQKFNQNLIDELNGKYIEKVDAK